MKKWLCVLLFLSVVSEAKELRECERSPYLAEELFFLTNGPALEGEEAKAILEEAIEMLRSNDYPHDPNICSDLHIDELTPLFAAMKNDNIPLMKVLMNMDIDIDRNGLPDGSYFADSSKIGNLYVMQRKNEENHFPKSILIYAALIESKAIDFIIEQAPDLVHLGTPYGYPIHAAAEMGHLDAFEKLEKADADLYVKGENGQRAIHYIARRAWRPHQSIEEIIFKQKEMIKHLIKKGFDINERDGLGITPYLHATFNYNIEALEYMQKTFNADPFSEDNEGYNALDVVAFRDPNVSYIRRGISEEESREDIRENERRRLEVAKYLVEKVGIIPDEETIKIARETLSKNYEYTENVSKPYEESEKGLLDFISYLESKLPKN